MARTTKKKEAVKETAVIVTRAEKKDATKNLIREILAINPMKHNELIDEVAKAYSERFGEQTDNVNDVKGRVGSVLDIMKKESDVMYEGGMYALKARLPMPEPSPEPVEAAQEEKPTPKKRGRKPKAKAEETASVEEKTEEKAEPLPPAPLQPIAPTAPITPETAPEPIPEEKPAPKKRGRKPKAKTEEAPAVVSEEKPAIEEGKAENEAPMVEVKAEEPAQALPVIKAEEIKEETLSDSPKTNQGEETKLVKPVMDMSFLFGSVKPVKTQEKEGKKEPVKSEKKSEVKEEAKPASKTLEVKEEKPVEKAQKAAQKTEKPLEDAPKAKQAAQKAVQSAKVAPMSQTNVRKLPARSARKTEKPLTAEEKLREAFLKKIRSLGGDYFEYYSVYLLERYSMKNGRRLEGMKISGGDHDGGIDGEIELTDKLGFKETIYIQSKNWNPEKGDEKLWVVGETLLQQFIGACACRQAKDGKQNCRGIFITTSRFTPEAKRILEDMSDKIVGYDGNDLFEAAKECEFGLIRKNGEWTLDERLLAGSKAFFNLY